MKADKIYDERQLLSRGTAFQAGFIAALLTIGGIHFLEDFTRLRMSSYSMLLASLWIPMSVCMIVLIVKDAYDGVNRAPGRAVFTIIGLTGAALCLLSLYHLLTDGTQILVQNGEIRDDAGNLFTALCMITVSLIYWWKQYSNNKKFRED